MIQASRAGKVKKNNSTISFSMEAWKSLALSLPNSLDNKFWHIGATQQSGNVPEMSALAWNDLKTAIEQYELWRETPLYRDDDFPVIWQEEASRVFELGGEGDAVFLVPSMINRHEILHLPRSSSIANYLIGDGFKVYLLDWGLDDERSRNLNMETLQARLSNASAAIGKSALLGYCLGGTLAHLTDLPNISRQVLLGAPWKFLHDQGRIGLFAKSLHDTPLDKIEEGIENIEAIYGVMPALYVDYIFAILNPLQFVQKFRNRGERQDLEKFDALEDWLNSGQNLPIGIVKTLLTSWFRDDKLLQIEGLDRPTLAIYGQKDHIAPPKSCEAIAQSGKNVQLLKHNAGHVGLLVGNQSQGQVWPQISEFLNFGLK